MVNRYTIGSDGVTRDQYGREFEVDDKAVKDKSKRYPRYRKKALVKLEEEMKLKIELQENNQDDTT